MADPERVRVWWNPGAGRARTWELAERVLHAARDRGNEAALLPPELAEATAQATAEIAAGAVDRLIVIGGDGTVHHAIQVAAGTPATVGIVPAGTGNDLARALGLPDRTDAAIEAALGPPSPIDLLHVDGRHAATVATFGFSVAVNRRAELMRWPRGSAKYTVATVAELVRLRPYPITLHVDGRTIETAPNLVAVANTSIFGGGMAIAPDARADDGLLDVVVIGPAPRRTWLRLLPGVRSGRHVRHPSVEVIRAARVEVVSEEPLEIWADGEAVASTPTAIETAPGALHLAGHHPLGSGQQPRPQEDQP